MKKNSLTTSFSDWVRKGQNDLRTAEILIKEKGPTDTLCFHCHQSVEKYLKAGMVKEGIKPLKIHDLWKLAKLIAKKEKNILKFEIELKNLNAYYIESRYPTEVSVYSEKVCRKLFKDASEITQYIAKAIL